MRVCRTRDASRGRQFATRRSRRGTSPSPRSARHRVPSQPGPQTSARFEALRRDRPRDPGPRPRRPRSDGGGERQPRPRRRRQRRRAAPGHLQSVGPQPVARPPPPGRQRRPPRVHTERCGHVRRTAGGPGLRGPQSHESTVSPLKRAGKRSNAPQGSPGAAGPGRRRDRIIYSARRSSALIGPRAFDQEPAGGAARDPTSCHATNRPNRNVRSTTSSNGCSAFARR